MELLLERITSDRESTIGTLYAEGRFQCFTLEDEYRLDKVPEETRIPHGTYDIRLRPEGGMHPRYAAKFPFHRGMLCLQDVPGFEWIYIHIGNAEKHTAGCILVGDGALARSDNMSLQASTDAYTRLYRQVVDHAAAGDLRITIKDRDL